MTNGSRDFFVMRRGIARCCLAVMLGVVCSFLTAPRLHAQTNAVTSVQAKLAAEDKEACIRKLKIIYEAIQAYRQDHKDLPNWLSDLVPQYLNDVNVLICPACKRTGQTDTSALSDPKIPSSYLFEFCPLPLGPNEVPNNPSATRREWKRRQMGLVGAVVPIVRCRHHAQVLNVAFDGHIYESPPNWETLLTNEVNIEELKPGRMFAGTTAPAGSPAPKPLVFPQR